MGYKQYEILIKLKQIHEQRITNPITIEIESIKSI